MEHRTHRIEVTLLDGLCVRRDGSAVALAGSRLRGLLTRLALAAGRPVDPAVLVEALWPQGRPAAPGNALQSLVSRLRRALDWPGAVEQSSAGYRLAVGDGDVDTARFEQLTADGRRELRDGRADRAAQLLTAAVALGAGELAAEVTAVAAGAAVRLGHAVADAHADLADAQLRLGRSAEVADRLPAALAGHPRHERLAGLLIDALAAEGRQADALAAYERVRRTLVDELGTEPGAALRARHLRLLQAPSDPPGGDPQLSAADLIRPAATAPMGRLPAPLTSFVGRDGDLARVWALLAAGRLVTVLGPGGAGKTRLAVEAAHRAGSGYADGVWLVDLAPVTEPAEVPATVLTALGLRGGALFETRRARRDGRDLVELLVDHLGPRQTLLVVDNCEHLVDAVARTTGTLLARCPRLRVLATSREPLVLDGEALVPLAPLELPADDAGPDEARQAPAVRLFVARAAAVRPGFAVDELTVRDVVEVVRRLDGDLLTADERILADHVAVLPAGPNRESAVAVSAGAGIDPDRVPELLAALVDRSVLHLSGDVPRYRMLETLREYGIERLAESGVLTAARDRAAGHVATLVAAQDPRLRTAGQMAALRVLAAEYDNALAGLRHLCDRGDGPAARQLALDLFWHWHMLGRHAEALFWLDEAAAAPGDDPGTMVLIRAVGAVSRLGTTVGLAHAEDWRAWTAELAADLAGQPDPPGPIGVLVAVVPLLAGDADGCRERLARRVDGGDRWCAAFARLYRARMAENDGDLAQVRADVRGALAGFEELGDRWGRATALPMRAMIRQYDGDLDGALADLHDARALSSEFGSLDISDEVFVDLRLADLHLRRGEPEPSAAALNAARNRAERHASVELVRLVDALEAAFRVVSGDLDRAEQLLARATDGVAWDTAMPFGDHGTAIVGVVTAALALARGQVATADTAVRQAYAAAVASQDMPLLGMVGVGAAQLAAAYGRHHDVAALLGAAARVRGAEDPTDVQISRLTADARAALGDAAFAHAYEAGWALDVSSALARLEPA